MKYLPLLLLLLPGCTWIDRHNLSNEYAPIETPVACDDDNCSKKCWTVVHKRSDGSIVEKQFHCEALALPASMMHEYKELVHFIQMVRPGYTVALVHENEEPRGDVAWTGLHYQGLRVWMVREGQSKKLFNRCALMPWSKKNQYDNLKKFIAANRENYEVVLVKDHEVVEGGEKTPFMWSGYRVWVVKAS